MGVGWEMGVEGQIVTLLEGGGIKQAWGRDEDYKQADGDFS